MSSSGSKTRDRATYEDVATAPAHMVAEVIEGDLYLSPRPRSRHARACGRLFRRVAAGYEDGVDGPGGWWFLLEPEFHFGAEIVVPDIAGWRRERMPVIPDVAFFELAPDWICEVLSPKTESVDRGKKLREYARAGVGHVWLVNPLTRTLEVLRLQEDRWLLLAVHAGDEVVHAEPFAALALDLGPLWGEEGSQAP